MMKSANREVVVLIISVLLFLIAILCMVMGRYNLMIFCFVIAHFGFLPSLYVWLRKMMGIW